MITQLHTQYRAEVFQLTNLINSSQTTKSTPPIRFKFYPKSKIEIGDWIGERLHKLRCEEKEK